MDEFMNLKEICDKFKITDARAQHYTRHMLKRGKGRNPSPSGLLKDYDYITTRRKENRYNSSGIRKIVGACTAGTPRFRECMDYISANAKPVRLFPPKEDTTKPYVIKEWGRLF